MYLKATLISLLVFFGFHSVAQTLQPGDVVVVGFNASTKEFALLATVDLPIGTSFSVTDNGWSPTTGLTTSEGVVTYTGHAIWSAGVVKTVRATDYTNSAASSDFYHPSDNFNISTAGDQLLIYQGAATSPTFIYGLNYNAKAWANTASNTNTSALPSGLINGLTAVSLINKPQYKYAQVIDVSDRARLLTDIGNYNSWNSGASSVFYNGTANSDLALYNFFTGPATRLNAGDVAIIACNDISEDEVVMVTLVPIGGGTQIKITDRGWNSTSGFYQNEGTVVYTAPNTGLIAGSIIRFKQNSLTTQFYKLESFDLSTTGDQVLLYQGSETAPQFIYGFNTRRDWTSNGTAAQNSQAPNITGTGGSPAVRSDIAGNGNGYYTGPQSGTTVQLLQAIATPSNYTFTGNNQAIIPQYSLFNVGNFTGLNCVSLAAAPSADQNYVQTLTPRKAFTTASVLTSQTACDVMQSIQYLDGLGRPVQTVQVKGNSNASQDLIQPVYYDDYGRESKKFLPYTTSIGASGSYRSDALQSGTGVNYYYNNPTVGVKQMATPFAETKYEPSELNRVIEQGASGDDWQLSAGHTIKSSYGVNIANDVRIYTAEAEGAVDEEYKRNLASPGYYDAGELYLTIIKNENWVSANGRENTAEEYKDKEGRVLLKRTFAPGGTALSTYYVYDYRGNLCFVLPPKENPDVTGANNITQTMLDELCYQYLYDGRNRLIEKKIPGKDWEYMVYNSADQMVAYQDVIIGNYQRAQWKVIKYDYLGREILTGIYYDNSTLTNGHPTTRKRIDMQALVDQNTNLFETRAAGSDYTNVAWPTAHVTTKLTVKYYDDYAIPGLPALYDQHTTNSLLTKNLPTASITNILNSADQLWTVSYYDDFGRLTNLYRQLYYLGIGNLNIGNYDHISNSYNFDNQLSSSTRQQFIVENSLAVTTPIVTIANTFNYDHLGRRKQLWEQISTNRINNTNVSTTTGSNILLSQIDYNDVGQATKKHLHSEDNGSSFLQDINYSYNERGWTSRVQSHLLDEQLRYNTQAHSAKLNYNGNVSEQEITTLTGNRYFTYAYDNLNRLTDGVSSNGLTSETGIQYDDGGNITHLNRNGGALNYTYIPNTNKIASVSGIINSSSMAYDLSGYLNFEYRDDKYIEEDPNIVGLPEDIGGSQDMSLLYDANGQKWETENNQTGVATEYMSGINYVVNGSITLDYIQTEEGRAVPDGNGGFKYEYTLKDHLGSNRVNFDRDQSTSMARRIQEYDYFPFGKTTVNPIYSFGGDKNEFLYNGKEHLELLNESDYGARMYDAEIGRWKSIDPLAEKSRRWNPYNYGFNNPISNIDPDGMAAGRFEEEGNERIDNSTTGPKTLTDFYKLSEAEKSFGAVDEMQPEDGPRTSNKSNNNAVGIANLGKYLGKSADQGGDKPSPGLTQAQMLAKYGQIVAGKNVVLQGGVLSQGIVAEYGTVMTNKNWNQDYYTIYHLNTTAAVSIGYGGFAITGTNGYRNTFSDWAGRAKEAGGSYGIVSLSYGFSNTYKTWGGTIGPSASFPNLTGSYITGTTYLMGQPYQLGVKSAAETTLWDIAN